jgi:hypothetical protein
VQFELSFARIDKTNAFSAAIANLPRNGEGLLMEVDRPLILPQTVVRNPQTA